MFAVKESRADASDEKDKKHLDLVKKALEPSVNPLDTFMDISKNRVHGTGDWVRNEKVFKAWYSDKFPILSIGGTSGSGKSYLAGNIIEYLQEHHPQVIQHPSRKSVSYVFFKDNSPETRSVHQAHLDMAYQISQNDKFYAKHVASLSQKDIKSIRSAWRSLYIEFFVQNGRVDSSVYLILDGFDEADTDNRQLFPSLLSDIPRGSSRSKFFSYSFGV